MNKSIFLTSRSQNIRVQIQRQQIDKIIKNQKKRNNQQTSKIMSQTSYIRQNKISDEERRMLSSHPNVSLRKRNFPKVNQRQAQIFDSRYSLKEQIHYFSIKKHYEKIINSTTDRKLMIQLKSQLNSPRQFKVNQTDNIQSKNFFQKVFDKNSRMHRYFQQIKHNRRQMARYSQELNAQLIT